MKKTSVKPTPETPPSKPAVNKSIKFITILFRGTCPKMGDEALTLSVDDLHLARDEVKAAIDDQLSARHNDPGGVLSVSPHFAGKAQASVLLARNDRDDGKGCSLVTGDRSGSQLSSTMLRVLRERRGQRRLGIRKASKNSISEKF